MMTKEQMDILSQFEDRFRTAVYSDYARNLSTRKLDEIRNIWDEAFPDQPLNTNWSCSHCVLDFLRRVGKIYFLEKNNKASVVSELTPIEKARAAKAKKRSQISNE